MPEMKATTTMTRLDDEDGRGGMREAVVLRIAGNHGHIGLRLRIWIDGERQLSADSESFPEDAA